ncbi:rhodanese-like domain-containing protein [Mesobacillus zeae]|uniref:Rhodanese-like domain-containing protein n=1 Tax=Mesobacillus zeae TaxID=1917180 RepID=A0A398BBI7_9BACI|nr:rhodanese-like domain-containing protein [Mesobacillus zeae]RID87529.1 rhodanese-like domain-containing protein [Mesobacillus zeae]
MTVKKISPEGLYEKMKGQEKVVLLDVRAEEKYKAFHIEEAGMENININKSDIFTLAEDKEASIESLPKDKEIIVTCTTGNSATKCATILSEREYDVVVLDGGITAWKKYLETK